MPQVAALGGVRPRIRALAERRTRWREEREREEGGRKKEKCQGKPKHRLRPPTNQRPNQDCLWAARESRHAQRDLHRADHHRPSPNMRSRQKTTLNQRTAHPPHSKTHQRQLRPPARPQLATPQVPYPAHRSSSATGLTARSPSVGRTRWRATSMRPTESEGSRRQAATRMRQGQSGANAPDRNRGRPPSGPPGRGATYEATPRINKPSIQKTYSNFPGFIIPLGSKTRLISRINRNSTASLLCRKCSRLSCPIPCSALMLPP